VSIQSLRSYAKGEREEERPVIPRAAKKPFILHGKKVGKKKKRERKKGKEPRTHSVPMGRLPVFAEG